VKSTEVYIFQRVWLLFPHLCAPISTTKAWKSHNR